jgi:hypothetical protein
MGGRPRKPLPAIGDASQLHRFIRGTGRLTTDSLDKIGAVLGLRFIQERGK